MPSPAEKGDPCGKCHHEFDFHVLIATSDDGPLGGGIILCPVMGCECYATWGVAVKGDSQSDPPKSIPDRAEVAALRERIQLHHAKKEAPDYWSFLPGITE